MLRCRTIKKAGKRAYFPAWRESWIILCGHFESPVTLFVSLKSPRRALQHVLSVGEALQRALYPVCPLEGTWLCFIYQRVTKAAICVILPNIRAPGGVIASTSGYDFSSWRIKGICCSNLIFLPFTTHPDVSIGKELHPMEAYCGQEVHIARLHSAPVVIQMSRRFDGPVYLKPVTEHHVLAKTSTVAFSCAFVWHVLVACQLM